MEREEGEGVDAQMHAPFGMGEECREVEEEEEGEEVDDEE